MNYVEKVTPYAALRLLHSIAQRPPVVAPRVIDKPLVLYGAGNLGRMAREYLDHLALPYLYVVDGNAKAHRKDHYWDGTAIHMPDAVDPTDKRDALVAVCVATSPFTTIQQQLQAQGWIDVVPFYDIAEAYRDRHPLSNGWFTGTLDTDELQRITQVMSCWADDISRAHHLQFIAWHSLREDWFFECAPVTTDDRYFISQILSVLHHNEVLVDIGAHHGEVATRFAQLVDDRFNGIVAIEADSTNFPCLFTQLKRLAKDTTQLNITALPYALGSQAISTTFMDGLGYASQICDYGNRTIDVKTLDQLQLSPTFIKLHLEGGELEALKGGLQTIRTHRPIIAATCYHNRLGLSELPAWLQEHLAEYVFLMRLHSWCGTGAVIYCIPKERNHTTAMSR